MAESKPISYSQIAEPNLLEPLKKELIEVNKLLGITGESLKEVISGAAKIAKQTPLDSFKNLEKVEKGIQEATEAVKGLDKIEKDRLKLQARIKDLDDERIKANFDLSEQVRLQTKELRDNAKATAASNNAYKRLKKETNGAQKELKTLSVEFEGSSKEAKKAEKGIQAATEAVKGLDKIEKDRLKLQARIKDLDDGRIKANFDLNEQVRLQTKELRDNAKATAASNNAYERLKKETNDAQKKLKTLAAEFGVSSKEAKKAKKAFETLDAELREINEAAKDGRRDVGRYEKGVKGLTKTFRIFASATIILKVLDLLKTSITQNSDGAAALDKAMARVTVAVTVFASRIVAVFPVLQAKMERFFASIPLGFAKIENAFGGNAEEVARLQKEYNALSKTADIDLKKAFEGIADEIAGLTAKKIALIDATLRYRREIASLEQGIATLIPTQEKLRAQFEDDSTSLNAQVEAGVAFRESLLKTQALEAKVASKKLQLAQESAKVNRFNVEGQEELSAATREFNQLIADQATEVTSTEREIQKLRDDVVQQNLDFYIDDFDNRKTVNERIIADETQTFKTRRDLLALNLKDTEVSFDKQEEALNTSLKQRSKQQIDFDDLRKNSSTEEILEILERADLSEQLNIRVLEVLRERRTFLQDNAEAQRDLNASEAESDVLQSDIVLQRRALTKLQEGGVDLEMVLQTLADERLRRDIRSLQGRIEAAKEGSAEFISLNQELNDKLLEQDQRSFDKRKQQLKEFGTAANTAFQLLSDVAQRQSDRRLKSIDREISAEERRIAALKNLAALGNEDAENNIALAEQRQAQLELEREQQLRRQKQSEFALAAIQTYSGKVATNAPNPLASTIADISVLRAFINTLPGFYEGTEDTGTVTNPLDAKGGRLAVLHNNERVVDSKTNKLIGKMSNAELAVIASKGKKQELRSEASTHIVRELRELREITKNKPAYMGLDYDQVANAIVRKIKTGSKLEKIHEKNGGIWGWVQA